MKGVAIYIETDSMYDTYGYLSFVFGRRIPEVLRLDVRTFEEKTFDDIIADSVTTTLRKGGHRGGYHYFAYVEEELFENVLLPIYYDLGKSKFAEYIVTKMLYDVYEKYYQMLVVMYCLEPPTFILPTEETLERWRWLEESESCSWKEMIETYQLRLDLEHSDVICCFTMFFSYLDYRVVKDNMWRRYDDFWMYERYIKDYVGRFYLYVDRTVILHKIIPPFIKELKLEDFRLRTTRQLCRYVLEDLVYKTIRERYPPL